MCTLGDAAGVNPVIEFPATVMQGSEIPEGLMNNPVYSIVGRVYGSNKLRQGNSVKSLRAKEENVFKM
jgi:hypothetical protein